MEERKEKLRTDQQIHFQTNGRESLLNLTKICITTKGNGSVDINIENGSIIMNITMMTLI